ncbi:hypothetical protein C5167_006199 [Papaver somniferum]|uniref:Glucose-methanol-choline oxidoreductase N-terminal domain-containing protein n=1 Tax=Papaver somniferum TaxID=3469 RepID=A0A4Y7JCN0_PAPSO|nr:hypothetical protein C5167_006199 [Papaver somniferum]
MVLLGLCILVAGIVNPGLIDGLSYTDDQKGIQSKSNIFLVFECRLVLDLIANHLSHSGPKYTFVHEATSAPATSYYHYIIIGGGTAGCPLAATLSSNYNVLLIERGGSPYGNPNITNLSSFGYSLSDHSATSPSQRFISKDGVINSRARVLGGGTSLNAGFYSRAEPQYVKDSSWDGKLVNESYEWVEKMVAFKAKVEAWQSAVRDGLLEAGVLPNNGFTFDHINGTKIGGTIFDRKGQRHTAADLLQYANPKRLTVLLHATVSRILFRWKGKQKPVAYGVIFTDASVIKHKAYLNQESGLGSKNEIVLSAGALGSPQLLMLSGVGPADHLRSLNITVVVDQPLVGQGMSDSPVNAVYVPSPIEVEVSLAQVVGITEFGSYVEAVSGANYLERAFGNVAKDLEIFLPHNHQLHTTNVPPKQREVMKNDLNSTAFKGGFIVEKLIGPLTLYQLAFLSWQPRTQMPTQLSLSTTSKNPKTSNGVLMVLKQSRRYDNISFQALLNLTSSFPINLVPKTGNDPTSLVQFCKFTVLTIWHYHGGCQVGKVIDQDYKVLGVDSLRVIDGSTFINSPGTNPQATTMMLGRYNININ